MGLVEELLKKMIAIYLKLMVEILELTRARLRDFWIEWGLLNEEPSQKQNWTLQQYVFDIQTVMEMCHRQFMDNGKRGFQNEWK